MSRTLLIFLLIIFSTFPKAQWECPSAIGGSLKPFGESNWMWATELISTTAYISDNSNYIANGEMVFGSLDYSKNKYSFYLEGGFKIWNKYNTSTKTSASEGRIGLREAFFNYTFENYGNLRIGLQSAKLDDDYLLNERILGISYKVPIKMFDFKLVSGTVSKQFSRAGTFCSKGFLYDAIVLNREFTTVGNKLGRTNFAGASLSFVNRGSKDEFAEKTESFIKLNNLGITGYSEFGSEVAYKNIYWVGIFSNIEFIKGITFKPEILFQDLKNERCLIYDLSITKKFFWENTHKTDLYMNYCAYKKIDDNAHPVNSFSNLFVGEVARLDAPDLPFFIAGIKHTIPNYKTHFKLQFVYHNSATESFYDEYKETAVMPLKNLKEYDFELGKKFFDGKLSLNIINSLISNDKTIQISTDEGIIDGLQNKTSYMGRIEIRFLF